MSVVYDSQTGEWTVVGQNGERLESFMSEAEANKWMHDNKYSGNQDDDNQGDDDGDDIGGTPDYGFDWQGKFNLDLNDLMSQYDVPEDMKKYFEGMEYDPQAEGFIKSLMDLGAEERGIKEGAIGREKGNIVTGYGQSVDTLLQGGEAASYASNQEAQMRGTQIGGMRGGGFADRYKSQVGAESFGMKTEGLMSQAVSKTATLDDALSSLDIEARSADVEFQEDIYGKRKQWMDDFFSRLMEVKQYEEA